MSKPLVFALCVTALVLVGAAWWLWMAPSPETDPRAEMCRQFARHCEVHNSPDCKKQLRSICAQSSGELLRVRN